MPDKRPRETRLEDDAPDTASPDSGAGPHTELRRDGPKDDGTAATPKPRGLPPRGDDDDDDQDELFNDVPV